MQSALHQVCDCPHVSGVSLRLPQCLLSACLCCAGAENARKLVEIEDQILAVLSSNQGSILDDGEAVAVLQAAKALSDEIAVKQQDAAKTEVAIDKVRQRARATMSAKRAGACPSQGFWCPASITSVRAAPVSPWLLARQYEP